MTANEVILHALCRAIRRRGRSVQPQSDNYLIWSHTDSCELIKLIIPHNLVTITICDGMLVACYFINFPTTNQWLFQLPLSEPNVIARAAQLVAEFEHPEYQHLTGTGATQRSYRTTTRKP